MFILPSIRKITMKFTLIILVLVAVGSVQSTAKFWRKDDQCQLTCKNEDEIQLTEVNGALYYIHEDIKNLKNWHEASDFCKRHGMELVTIETKEEDDAFVQKLVTYFEIPDGSGHRTFWMGLNDLANEGVFRWISNGKVTNFTNWHINEPNNSFATGVPEHCVEFYLLRGATKWNDRPCVTWKSRFVCEFQDSSMKSFSNHQVLPNP